MPDYIDREELIRRIDMVTDTVGFPGNIAIKELIYNVPAADVAPVVHGYWIEHIDSYENYCECSVCHYSPDSPLDETPYCPHCGAKMVTSND